MLLLIKFNGNINKSLSAIITIYTVQIAPELHVSPCQIFSVLRNTNQKEVCHVTHCVCNVTFYTRHSVTVRVCFLLLFCSNEIRL